MWAAGTVWHAWGLPMRLDGDSDMVAWPNDLQNRKRGGAGTLTEALFALLSSSSALVFVFGEIHQPACFK